MIAFSAWWHRLLGHSQVKTKVSVPSFDPSAKGILIKCNCGDSWAL